MDCALGFQNGLGKAFRILHRKAQYMESKPLGGLAANTGQARKLIGQILQRRGKKLHTILSSGN